MHLIIRCMGTHRILSEHQHSATDQRGRNALATMQDNDVQLGVSSCQHAWPSAAEQPSTQVFTTTYTSVLVSTRLARAAPNHRLGRPGTALNCLQQRSQMPAFGSATEA